MKLSATLCMVITIAFISFAGGQRGSGDNGAQNGAATEIDTNEISGTVSAFSDENKWLVVNRTFGEDTIYWTEATRLSQSKEVLLSQDAKVKVWYIEMAKRKVAVRIDSDEKENGSDGSGANGSESETLEIEGTVESVTKGDSMIVVQTADGKEEIHYGSSAIKAKEQKNILKKGAKVKVWYKEEQNMNRATRIELSK